MNLPCFESSGKGISRVGDDAIVGEGVLLSLFEGRGGDTSPISVSLNINREYNYTGCSKQRL